MAENAIYQGFEVKATAKTAEHHADLLHALGMIFILIIGLFALNLPAVFPLEHPVGLGISDSLILALLIIIAGIISGLRIQS